MKTRIISVITALAFAGCATTDTTGFTKEERKTATANDQKAKETWSLFGITILSKLVDVGIASFSNGVNERKLPRTFEK